LAASPEIIGSVSADGCGAVAQQGLFRCRRAGTANPATSSRAALGMSDSDNIEPVSVMRRIWLLVKPRS